MKYATWVIKRPEGTTPEPTVRAAGGWAEGGCMLDADTVLGYLSDDADVSALADWSVVVKTQAEALSLAQAVNPEAFIGDGGIITAPVDDETP